MMFGVRFSSLKSSSNWPRETARSILSLRPISVGPSEVATLPYYPLFGYVGQNLLKVPIQATVHSLAPHSLADLSGSPPPFLDLLAMVIA